MADLKEIGTASRQEIACLVEILYNIHKIAFNRSERNSISQYLHIVRYIGKCRDLGKARELLKTFAHLFIRPVLRAVVSSVS